MNDRSEVLNAIDKLIDAQHVSRKYTNMLMAVYCVVKNYDEEEYLESDEEIVDAIAKILAE